MLPETLSQIKGQMTKSVDHLSEQLKSLRTGRANSAMVEDVLVTYYGAKTPLKQVATIQIPESSLIVIQPWDPKALNDIEQGIREAELGMNPTNDGRVIRLSLPPLTTERRTELIKMLHKMGEETRVVIRNIRKEAWDSTQAGFKKGDVTEDDKYRTEEQLNKIVDEYNNKIEEIIKLKEQDLQTV
ncbi:MAG: ribosome recycling factor [Patescibacteria group bacterium]|jgi:ribosome recycling factor